MTEEGLGWDSVTDLHNRAHLLHELERHVALYGRYRHPFALLMLCLPDLEWVNATFGHEVGAAALAHLAGVLRTNIRDVDIPGRLGQAELLALMPEADKNGHPDGGAEDC